MGKIEKKSMERWFDVLSKIENKFTTMEKRIEELEERYQGLNHEMHLIGPIVEDIKIGDNDNQ